VHVEEYQEWLETSLQRLGEMQEQLSIMAAEKGCDREAEYDGCSNCPSHDGCVRSAWKLAESARKLKGGV